VGRACGTHGRGQKNEESVGGLARWKEATRKAEASMGGWDQT
jgi:hypothetical protein